MTAPPIELPYGPPDGDLYAPDVVSTELMGIEAARKVLGDRITKAVKEGTHTVMTRHGQPEGVLVDMAWYRKARKALKDSTDL